MCVSFEIEEREKMGHCHTFLTEGNGEWAFILDINNSLLDNNGPRHTEKGLVRLTRAFKEETPAFILGRWTVFVRRDISTVSPTIRLLGSCTFWALVSVPLSVPWGGWPTSSLLVTVAPVNNQEANKRRQQQHPVDQRRVKKCSTWHIIHLKYDKYCDFVFLMTSQNSQVPMSTFANAS